MTRLHPLTLAAALICASPSQVGADVQAVAQRGFQPITIRTPPPKVVIERRRATGQDVRQQALEAQINWGTPTPATAASLQPMTYVPVALPPPASIAPRANTRILPSGRAGRGTPPPPTVFDDLRSLPISQSHQAPSAGIQVKAAASQADVRPVRTQSASNLLRPSPAYNAETLVSSLRGPALIRVQADITNLGGNDLDPTALSRDATVDDLIEPPPSAFIQQEPPSPKPDSDLFDSPPIVENQVGEADEAELVPIPPRPARVKNENDDPAESTGSRALPNFSDLPIGVDAPHAGSRPPPRAFPSPGTVTVPLGALAAPGSTSPAPSSTDHNITVGAGKNQIIEVARFHLNRLVTPIQNPVIRTTSTAQVDIQSDVIYVAAVDDQPIALYITGEGNEDLAIVLTLIPRAIPPREVRLSFSGEEAFAIGPASPQPRPEAQSWEQRQPYVNTIMGLLRSAAGGDVPPGYRLRRHTVKDPAVFCSDPFLQVEPVQILEGHALSLTVSAVKNISQSDITINELQCHLPGVAAVSAYPTPFLRPGQSAELYVVNRKYVESKAARTRPPVIDPDYLR